MDNAKMQLNSTQIPNVIIDEWPKLLNGNEFKIAIIIARQTYGWHKDSDRISYSQLIEKADVERQTVANALRKLRVLGLVMVMDENGKELLTKDECRGRSLFYRLVLSNQSKNRTSKIILTKDTYTKDFNNINIIKGSIGTKVPHCPLLNGSPLKAKYPNGHQECVEYILGIEKDRGRGFTNKVKQYQFLHKILRAGLGFDKIDLVINQIEKKYGAGQFDFSTIANWLDKGAGNGN